MISLNISTAMATPSPRSLASRIIALPAHMTKRRSREVCSLGSARVCCGAPTSAFHAADAGTAAHGRAYFAPPRAKKRFMSTENTAATEG